MGFGMPWIPAKPVARPHGSVPLDTCPTERSLTLRSNRADGGFSPLRSLIRYCKIIHCHWVVISLKETRIANSRRYDNSHSEVLAISVRDAGVVAVVCQGTLKCLGAFTILERSGLDNKTACQW